MAAPRFDPRVRIFVLDTWVDITDRVILGEDAGVEITTGSADESKGVDPGSCNFGLLNDDGQFTMRNPHSDYFPDLRRNTPVVVECDELYDRFGRVVASGWSVTDTGETWVTKSVGGVVSGTDYSVDGSSGVHHVPAAAAYRMSWLDGASGSPQAFNGEILIGPFTCSVANVTGAPLEVGVAILRAQSDTLYYQVRPTIETDESFKIAIYRDSGTLIAAAVVVPGTHAPGTPMWTRAATYDRTIYGKVWQGTLDDEPADWQIEVVDTLYGYGYFGVRTGVTAGNTNVPVDVKYSAVTIYPAQFVGEIPDWPQDFSDDGKHCVVNVEAAGILRRIGQGEADLGSSLRRFYEVESDPAPLAYYPMDGGSVSEGGQPSIGTHPLIVYATGPYGMDPTKIWGNHEMSSWLPDGAAVGGLTALTNIDTNNDLPASIKTLLNIPVTTFFALDFVRAGGAETKDLVSLGGASQYSWDLTFDAVADQIVVSRNVVTVATLTTADFGHRVFDGAPHHFKLTVTTSGANLDWVLYVDGVFEAAGGTPGTQLTTIDTLFMDALMATDLNLRVGYMSAAIYTDAASTSDLITAVYRLGGSSFDPADDRFIRLCFEEGIETFMGAGGLGARMGPQFEGSLIDQFDEIMLTDGGRYRELLSAAALHYDARSALQGRATSLTVDVGALQLKPPFRPIDDDQKLRNKIKASKRNGGTYTYEQASGRLGTSAPKSGGAGVYDDDVKANPYSDNQLVGIAQDRVARGTVDASRYPVVNLDLLADEVQASLTLRRQILNVFVSIRIRLTNMGRWHVYEDSDQLVVGMTKLITTHRYLIGLNCAPFPYRVFVLGTSRLEAKASTLDAGITASATTMVVDRETDSPWITTASHPADFPLDVVVGVSDGVTVIGERMTVTAIVIIGAGPTYTFTVTRHVNGVDRAWPAGSRVSVVDADPLG